MDKKNEKMSENLKNSEEKVRKLNEWSKKICEIQSKIKENSRNLETSRSKVGKSQ